MRPPATRESAGHDLIAKNITHFPVKGVSIVSTGSWVPKEVPEGHFGLVTIRSSLALNGCSLVNGVGIIDRDYKDEIELIVREEYGPTFAKGDRVAQIVFIPCWTMPSPGAERKGGFGSTGKV